jgi:hypothetical protein
MKPNLLSYYQTALTTSMISLFFVTLFSGCATMRSESIYYLPVSTTPVNAKIKVIDRKGKEIISTQSPDTLVLKSSSGYFKRAEYLIEVSHSGYETKNDTVHFIIDKKYYQNFLTSYFLPIGLLLIDPIMEQCGSLKKKK